MVKKKQSESVATKFSMVLRPRTTTGKEKVKEKAKRKMPVKVDSKVKVKKTAVSGKIKNGNTAKTGNVVITGNVAKRKLLVDEGNTKVSGSRAKKLKAAMNKKEMDKGAETGSTTWLRRLNSGKIQNGNAAKNGNSVKIRNAAKRKLLVDEGNTRVAESRVKKLKAMRNKKEIDKGAETGSTRVHRLNTGKIKNGNAAKTGNVVKTGNDAIRKLLVNEGNTKVAGSRVKKLKAVMKKKEIDKGSETGSTRVHRFNTRKKKNGNAAKTGNAVKTGTAAKRRLLVDEGNTKVAGSRVKKLKVVIKKKKMDKAVETGSTRVRRLNSAKNGDQFGKKDFKKKSAEASTKKLKKVMLVKKEAFSANCSPMPKKSLPVKASTRITRKGGMSETRASYTIADKIRLVQGLKNKKTCNNKNYELIKRKKANIVVTDVVFPPEIIMEILSWLPVKFFGTPMVVCKQWYALIQDRHFLEKHMRRNYNFIESNVGQGYRKVNSCDGLRLEMNASTQKYRILNPDTKQFLELPDPHKGSYHILFAYVPLTLNYKIVSIFYDKNNIECWEILSVGNDELSWRLLKMPTEDYLKRNRKKFSMKLIGDVVHCVRVIASENDTVEEVISLDLGTEQFTVSKLPKGQYRSWEKVWLIDYKGKPALVDIIGSELCVMVLENYKKQNWAKKESLFPLETMKKLEVEHGKISPYLVDRFETLWFWAKEARKFVSYNLKTKRTRSELAHCHSLVRLEGMQPE
ncbi:uncharacterized protein LOC141668555 [Apium graveolens]|uniref:uncharacterized protein LOC141668555 n=1 Tax=Apium graveolens TaxID=4045 RepID=UPI003D7A4635